MYHKSPRPKTGLAPPNPCPRASCEARGDLSLEEAYSASQRGFGAKVYLSSRASLVKEDQSLTNSGFAPLAWAD